MAGVSRAKTRRFLFQALYARSMATSGFSLDLCQTTAMEDDEDPAALDTKYLKKAFFGIISHERDLVAIVRFLAPRFLVEDMPLVNILPVFIGAYEMCFLESDSVPPKVSISEALGLARTYSDDSARSFVNGVLNTLKDRKDEVLAYLAAEIENTEYMPLFFPVSPSEPEPLSDAGQTPTI